ncbi:hypothetical protein [Deinococcus hopiensis]|uniref:Uncharacterized protein n=1 Tax=Deinococcus hopiensis KR-140 TaxID=695939 RepID=A0A1W1V505_9DEIO|nr:hypothetical protein [Deinococcus hopiensis]SMB88408.1 hypothetical protein SAMN00790413_00033 [Deinococcus hopiensis KR-140]
MKRLLTLSLLCLASGAAAQTWAGDLKPYEVKNTRICDALRVFAPEKPTFFRAYRINLPAFLARDIVQIAINKNGFRAGLGSDQNYVDFGDAGGGQGFLKKTYTSENRFITAYLDMVDRYATEICLIGN